MYYFQINPWSKNNISQHTSTLWEIATDREFTTTSIIEKATTDQSTGLNAYASSISIPRGRTYYIRATRQFAGLSAANHSLNPIPITSSRIDDVVNNNIIHKDSVRVEQPFIYVDMEQLRDNLRDTFNVRTSKFRCKQNGHEATHWIITDSEDNVLFTSLNDKFNKESIDIEKIRDISNASTFVIRAIHTSTNGIESPAGVYIVENTSFNFEIKGLTEDIAPQTDLQLHIVPTTARDKYITNVFLRSLNDNGEITKGLDVTPRAGSGVITIPGRELLTDRTYYLDIFAYASNATLSSKRITLKTRRSNFNQTLFPVNFKKNIQIYPSSQYNGLQLPRGFTTYQLPSGKILIPSAVTNNTSIYEVDLRYSSTASGGSVELNLGSRHVRVDCRLPNSQVTGDNAFLRVFNNNILIMDCGDLNNSGETKPRFFKYNMTTEGVFELAGSSELVSRAEEVRSVGSTAAIAQVSQNELWYIPSAVQDADKAIKSLNIETLEIQPVFRLDATSLGHRDLEQANNFGMIYNKAKKLIFIITDIGKEIVFDPIARRIKQIRDVKFTQWMNQDIKCLELPNGDYLVLNSKNIKETNSVLYYDCETEEYTPIPYAPSNTHVLYGNIQPLADYSFFINRTTYLGGSQDFTVSRVF